MKIHDKWIRRILFSLILVLGIIFLMRQAGTFLSVKGWFRSKPVLIDNTPMVIKEVKAIAELNTATMYSEIVVDSFAIIPAKIPGIVNPFSMTIQPVSTKKEIVLIVKGRVKAGINLENLSGEQVFVKDDSVSIILPKAKITDVFLNPSDIETFYENGDWSNEAVTAVKQSARRKLFAEAERRLLLQKADEKAKAVLGQFLKAAGFRKISISNER